MQPWGDLVKARPYYIGASFHSGASWGAPQTLGGASPCCDSGAWLNSLGRIWKLCTVLWAGHLHEPRPSSSHRTFQVELPGSQGLPRQRSTALRYFMDVQPVGIGQGCAVLEVPGNEIEDYFPDGFSETGKTQRDPE